MQSSGVPGLDQLLGGGYPARSAILIVGTTASSKEALCYRFIDAGLAKDDYCVYVTRLSVREATAEGLAQGLSNGRAPQWIASEGSEISSDSGNLAALSFNIKNLLRRHGDHQIRIVLDFLSPSLVLNEPESVYRFLKQLLADVKQHDAVLLAMLEQDMHKPEVVATMEDLFDGVVEVSAPGAEDKSPALLVKKMRGVSLPRVASARIEGGTLPEDSTAVGVAGTHRIAVLPFANYSPDPNDEYFADGMTEELISTISNIGELDVISRTSVMGYKGTDKKVKEIGNELEISSVLEGSVRKAGNKLRITIQLINVRDDMHLWAQSYDRELDDVFAVQSDIARRVAEVLRIRILPKEEKRIGRKPTDDMEAYALYLKGRYHWNRRSEEGMKKSIEFYQKAIEIDPRYALAYTGVSDSYLVLSNIGYIPRSMGHSKAREYATKALEIDDGLAEAHTSFASTLQLNFDWPGAEMEYKKAIAINPSYATAHHWYALLLELLGRFDEALREIHRAKELDPFSLIINSAIVRVLNSAGQYDRAIESGRMALDLEPNFAVGHLMLADAYLGKKMYAEAIQETQAAIALSPGDWTYRANLGYIYALSGNKEGEKILREVLERSATEDVPASYLAGFYFALGDEGRMFESLEKAYEEHEEAIAYFRFDPQFAKYRHDKRYLDLLAKMKLGDPAP